MAEQMKPSGIDWIGDIPSSWKCSKVKFCFSLVNGSTPESSDYDCWDGDIKWITPADMSDTGTISHGERFITKYGYNSCGTTLLPVGSIVISSRAPIGKINITTAELCTNQGCKSLIRYADNRYFYYLFLAGQNELSLLGRGTTFLELSTYDLNRFGLVVPAEDEQKVIADFLDKECAQIDSITADLEKQIELLQQYKKSLITETVTKGLDKTVPMKDSGVEWLGKIPAHWNFKRLKFMLENSSDSMKVGPFGSALSGSDFTDEGKWVYNQRVVLDNNFSENTTFVSEEKFQEMRSFAVCPGDILITTRGTIGKVAIVPEGANEGILHPCIIKFRVDKEMIIPELLQLIFNESDFVKDQFTLMSNATTIEVIYSYSLKDILLPVIPADEQKKIYGYLSKKCLAIDGIIAEKQKSLATITQHKKSLIYEYVTGKKRVKEVR